MPAGDPAQPSADTVNGRIARRLRDYARIRTGQARVRKRGTAMEIRQIVDDGNGDDE
jgi:hypothetical protein